MVFKIHTFYFLKKIKEKVKQSLFYALSNLIVNGDENLVLCAAVSTKAEFYKLTCYERNTRARLFLLPRKASV